MMRPSPPELMAETARLAYHLHWPLDTILDLEHRDRRAFLAEADALADAGAASEAVWVESGDGSETAADAAWDGPPELAAWATQDASAWAPQDAPARAPHDAPSWAPEG